MRTAWLVAAFWLIPIPAASGQRLYWGVIGGTGLTADFPAYDVSGPADAAAVEPSQFGVAIGAGAAFHLGKVRVAPTIRYTRWQKETGFPPYPSRADQIEFLTSVAWGTASDPLRSKGHRMGLGILAGLPLNREFYDAYSPIPERTPYLAGVSAQLELRHGLALEVDGIYKPLRAGANQSYKFSVLTWQFPVLAKYHMPKLGRAPFLEAGPSFRLAGNLNGYDPSHYGVTAGGGVETRTGGARLSTALRYTRWAKDAPPYWLPAGTQYDYGRTNANAVELVFGVAF